MQQELQPSQAERELQVAHTVSTLKSIADLTDGGDPRRAAERLAAKAIVGGLRAVHQPQVKQASGIERSAVALAADAELKGGPEFVDYEPATLRDMGFSDHEITKIMCAKLVMRDLAPFFDWHVFEKVVVAFNDREVQFDVTQEPSVAEIAWAVDEMRYIDSETPFGPEVEGYIAVAAWREGLVVLPKTLMFAEGVLMAQVSGYGRTVADQFAKGERNEATEVQLERLKAIHQYVNDRHRKLVGELRTLKR